MKIIIVVFTIALVAASCARKEQIDQASKDAIVQVDKNQRAFDPNFNADTTRLKLFLSFKFEKKQIVSEPYKIELVSGPMPYQPSQGTFKVSYKTAEKKDIGSVRILNPFMVRSCDDPEKPDIQLLENGVFFVQIPYSTEIAYLEMTDEENKELRPVEIDVAKILKAYSTRRK